MKSFKHIWRPKKLVIVFVTFQSNEMKLHASVFQLNKDLKLREFQDTTELIKHYGISLPYAIHVQGSGVLTRLVENTPNYKEQLIINGDKDEFYFTSYINNSNIASSFFRKSLLEKIHQSVKQNKVFLVSITSGILPILTTSNTLHVKYEYEILLDDSEIVVFRKQENYTNQDLKNENYCKSLTVGILKHVNTPSDLFSTSFENKEGINNFIDFQQFKYVGLGSLFTILFVLIGNYFYINFLNDRIANKLVELQLNSDNLSLLDRLEQEKRRKEQLILSAGINSKAFLSFYVDAIAKSVPSSIKLTQLSIFPLKEKLKEKRKVEIDSKLIEIKGITPNSSLLDDWMEKMNRMEWVERVELINYSQLDQTHSDFYLIIVLN